MATVHNSALDASLNYIKNNATVLHICSSAPTSVADMTSKSLGNKASPSLGAPSTITNGRRITLGAFSDGNVTGTGNASHWVLASGTEVLTVQTLSASQTVTSGNTFSLPATDISVTAI